MKSRVWVIDETSPMGGLGEEGATAVEYGLMVALIAAVIITAVVALGSSTEAEFKCVGDQLVATAPGNC